MDIDLTPEQLAKIQALNQLSQHDLSQEDMDALRDYAPQGDLNGDHSAYIGDKGKAYQDAQDKVKYNQMMQKIMFDRLSRRAQENPKHLDELYNSLQDRIK
jgi:hypothetical protein